MVYQGTRTTWTRAIPIQRALYLHHIALDNYLIRTISHLNALYSTLYTRRYRVVCSLGVLSVSIVLPRSCAEVCPRILVQMLECPWRIAGKAHNCTMLVAMERQRPVNIVTCPMWTLHSTRHCGTL